MFALTNEHLAAIPKPRENRKFRVEYQIYSFMFMHKISTRLVCLDGKHPWFHLFIICT